jgi:NTE family protein
MATNALVLSGGGARAAYQVGVLLAVSDILPHMKNPFPIICGTSAGGINAAAIAAHGNDFHKAAHDLANTWRSLEISQVYRPEARHLIRGGARVLFSLFNEGAGKNRALALLDNAPLRKMLLNVINFDNIQKRIDEKQLEALCITCLGYSSGESVNFFQGQPSLRGWRRYRRVGAPEKITVDHLMASSAIPVVFPAIKLSKEYFGDGAMRQMAPVSAALHLGASRVFIIGVSGNRAPGPWGHAGKFSPPKHSPSLAQIAGQMLNAAFIDGLEGDIEHLERINELLALIPEERANDVGYLREVDSLIISPTKRLDKIAGRRVKSLPKAMRFFMRSGGATAKGGGSAAASYLLFSHEYCNELIDLGYKDAMWEKDKIERFFESSEG